MRHVKNAWPDAILIHHKSATDGTRTPHMAPKVLKERDSSGEGCVNSKKNKLLQQTARWMYRLVSELSHPPAAPSYEALGVIVLWEINGCSEFLASSNCGDRANSK